MYRFQKTTGRKITSLIAAMDKNIMKYFKGMHRVDEYDADVADDDLPWYQATFEPMTPEHAFDIAIASFLPHVQ